MSRVESPSVGRPSIVVLPATTGRRPMIASISSVWPLPCTPATPSTSPACTVRSTPSTARWPRSSLTARPATSSTAAPGWAAPLSTRSSTERPTISEASSSSLVSGAAVPTVRPRRITVIRSAIAWTSLSLWVMKTIDLPAALSVRMISSRSCGLLRGQHGGRLVEDQQVDVAGQRLDDLDPLLHADRQVFDRAVGVDGQPVAVGDLADQLAGAPPVEEADRAAGGLLGAEHHVLGDGEHRHEHEVLVHHADAGRDRVARTADLHRLVVDQDLALVGLEQPVEDVHQRRLAGAVLAEQGMDLAGLDGQGYVVVGHEVAEALGDAAQFESQRDLPQTVWCGELFTIGPGRGTAGPTGVGPAVRPDLVHFGWAGEVTLTVPAMMSAFSLSTSPLSSGLTLLSKSWYGAMETPLFSSVPR